MASESVDFILTAKDKASSVFKATAQEIKLLDHQVQATSKNMKSASGAAASMAKAFGGTWLSSSISQFDALNSVLGKSSSVLSGAAGGSLAMKAGLVGLALYGGFTIGKMFNDWINDTKGWERKFEESMEKAKEQMAQLTDIRKKQIHQERKQITDSIKGSDAQIEKAGELKASLEAELREQKKRLDVNKRLASDQDAEWAKSLRGTQYRQAQTQADIKAGEDRIAMLQREIDATDNLTEAIKEQAAREAAANLARFEDMQQDLDFRIRTFNMTKEQIDLIKIQEDAKLSEEQKKILTEQLKTLHAKEEEKRIDEERLKLAEELRKEEEKRLSAALKQAEKDVAQAEKDLEKAESASLGLERAPTLQATDARLLTQQLSGPSVEEKQLASAQKQEGILKAQEELQKKQVAALEALLALEQNREQGDGGLEL